MKKRNLGKILFLVCFWVICSIFIAFYDASITGFRSEIDGPNYSFARNLLTYAITSLIASSILGSLEVLVLGRLLRKKPLGFNLLIKTTIYLIFIVIFTSFGAIYLYSAEIEQPMFSQTVLQYYLNTYLSARILSFILYWGVICMLGLFLLHVNDKFGQGVLLNFLLGKYHKPKEDQRIFMFLDLKSSTTYAEVLGHIKYSRLLQDCYYDLTEVVVKHRAKIYQYVGDEVVLSWGMENGLKHENCIRAFFAYEHMLQKRSKHYTKRYGLVPEFKAGVNMGKVTVAEVGVLKKELAYHGDVLNTAARIQGKCNEFNCRILVSEHIVSQFKNQLIYKFECLGSIMLKGKQEAVKIYSVN